jgi:hypothetical protein
MENSVRILRSLPALGLFLAAMVGCVPPGSSSSSPQNSGAVVVTFSDMRARTITPAVCLDIACYDLCFTCEGQPAVNLPGLAGGTTQTQPVYLSPGAWTIAAGATNAAGDMIGAGTAAVTVDAGKTSAVSLAIISLSGSGTLTLTASTSELSLSSPYVTGTITPGNGGKPIALSFAIGPGTATFRGALAAGSYLLQLELWDGTVWLARYVDTVLVVANFPSSAAFAFKPKNGSVAAALGDQVTRAIPISLAGAQSTLSKGGIMTVTALPAVTVDTYQWYLDGQAISGATASQVTVGTGLSEADYTLTVVVKKGPVYSSESAAFTVRRAP